LTDPARLAALAILELLHAEITRPEHTVRFRWEAGSVAFWDTACRRSTCWRPARAPT
jgi:taurine dioxygenase